MLFKKKKDELAKKLTDEIDRAIKDITPKLGGDLKKSVSVRDLFPTYTASSAPINYAKIGTFNPMTVGSASMSLTQAQANLNQAITVLGQKAGLSGYSIDKEKKSYENLPHSESTEPIKAQKVGYLVADKAGKIKFGSLTTNREYGVEETATHLIKADVPITWSLDQPNIDLDKDEILHNFRDKPDCHCGFYAVDDGMTIFSDYGSQILLDVELSGLVVRHATGYRAEKQKVRKIRIGNKCRCGKDAVGIIFQDLKAIPSCGCSDSIWQSFRMITLDNLRSELGIEVEWMQIPEEFNFGKYTTTRGTAGSISIAAGTTIVGPVTITSGGGGITVTGGTFVGGPLTLSGGTRANLSGMTFQGNPKPPTGSSAAVTLSGSNTHLKGNSIRGGGISVSPTASNSLISENSVEGGDIDVSPQATGTAIINNWIESPSSDSEKNP